MEITLSVRKSAPVRKGSAWLRQIPRIVANRRAGACDFAQMPVAVGNSFPKSGTHLLLQVLGGFAKRSFGTFLASTPSVTMMETSGIVLARKILRSAPGESIGAHLFFSEEVLDALRAVNAANYFIIRDPRDVVVSEAHYLSEMNHWHRLHRRFARLPSLDERLTLAIRGTPGSSPYYPDIGTRFSRYAQWLQDPYTLVVRYEDLVGVAREAHVDRIVEHYLRRKRASNGVVREVHGSITTAALERISAGKSHTFRRGQPGEWAEVFRPHHIAEFKRFAGDLLIKLGYESSQNW